MRVSEKMFNVDKGDIKILKEKQKVKKGTERFLTS